MLSHRWVFIWLAFFWIIVAAGYVWAATLQKQRINLSATAGGQFPYLVHAKGVAEKGVTQHFGDRNQLPLYPSLLALIYDHDWDAFVNASGWFAIASSVVILVGIGGLAYATLPRWPATVLTLTAVVCVFIYKASFVQAELLYYGLLLASWLLLCRLLRRPDARWAVLGGVLCGLTYLTKASGAAMLVAFGAAAAVQAVAVGVRAGRTPAVGSGKGADLTWQRVLLSAAVVAFGFTAVAGTYLSNNKERFGRYFYNVNSTFFMWCDSWHQARTFADTYRISEQYPQALPDEIPSPVNYWRSHTLKHMLRRLAHGLRALGLLALQSPCLKYLALAMVFCVVVGVRQCYRLRIIVYEDWIVVLFCALFFGGYILAYAWYAQVAYGDRFLLSLFLPAMFATLWVGLRLAQHVRHVSVFGRRASISDVFAIALAVLLLGEGTYTATATLYEPSEAFIQFYYNESRDLQQTGDVREAAKGFAGVLRMDPGFGRAHHSLGMIALATGRFEEAITSLAEAARLLPQDADVHNSLGSALIQAGRTEEAIRALTRATELDPDFAIAWYNLGGSYVQHGSIDRARAALRRLENIDPALAGQLAALLED